MTKGKRLYLLDTNVLMHDPSALFRFEEHDIYLPMIVLEELDRAKKGVSEVARNVRQVSRFLGQLMNGGMELHDGIELREPEGVDLGGGTGRLYFQTHRFENGGDLIGDGSVADNEILHAALSLREEFGERDIVLVSKDINLRIKAAIHGVHAEDYFNDRALNDLSLLYSGVELLEPDFWESHPIDESWNEAGRTYYRLGRIEGDDWHPNQCLTLDEPNGLEAIVREVDHRHFSIQVADDYRGQTHGVWGIHARNPEQNFALNRLMDAGRGSRRGSRRGSW